MIPDAWAPRSGDEFVLWLIAAFFFGGMAALVIHARGVR